MKHYIPYTYLVKCPDGSFYYGVKYANNKRDVSNPRTFWVNYFTSCNKIKELLKIHPVDDFEFEIRRTFSDSQSAISWESKVNRRLTTKSEKFLNDSYWDGRDQSGTNNGNYGKTQSDEAKRKAVETRRLRGSYQKGVVGTHLHDPNVRNKQRSTLLKNNEDKRMLGKSCRLYDIVEIYNDYLNYEFPDGWDKNLTGTAPTKITYFVKYYIGKFPCKFINSKTPYASLRSSLMKHIRYIDEGIKPKL